MRRLVALLLIVMLLGTACGDSSSGNGSRIYLSLGDSIAAGNGASDAAKTSFPALLADARDVALVNLAVAGATTQDVIDKQIPQAVDSLEGGDISFITLSAGGNDLAALIPNPTCQQEPLPASCPLDDALVGVEANLVTIMDRLREAYPGTPIVVLGYPNFFSGTGHQFDAPASRVLPQLDLVIDEVAGRYERTAVAHAAPAFDGRGTELTHVNDEQFDPHPNDAGHEVIARAFEEALDGLQ